MKRLLSPTARLERRARRAEERGDRIGAIAAWTRADDRRPDPAVEEHLADLRCAEPGEGRPDRGPAPLLAMADPFPRSVGTIPEIDASALSAAVVGGAIRHHGSLIVRGLLDPSRVAALGDTVERAFAAREDHHAGAPREQTTPWFVPCAGWSARLPADAARARMFVRQVGSAVHVVDSPRALHLVLGALRRVGLPRIASECLGERAVLTANKTTLRLVPPAATTGWHQDGSFMGADVQALNVWVALTPCGTGTEAPGLHVVPRRIDEIAPVPGGPNITVAGSAVAAYAPPVTPFFAAGDALVFDQMLLHSTGGAPGLTTPRLALETWMFRASDVPAGYLPVTF
ncbi:MAG: phytanoyl-CoA dioxygenase family protein [Actinomycetota bacterium]